jgi:multidrug efflux pump subunit AcrA (membrane-fusion protein)
MKNTAMKNYFLYFTFLICLILTSCHRPVMDESPIAVVARTPVEITSIQQGNVNDNLELFGTTFYLKRNVVTATIPAFITGVRIKLGDRVKQGEMLYEMESKERRALGNNAAKLDTSLSTFGIIRIKAPASGIISTLDKQQPGDYVLEGTQLCTIAGSNDLAFQVNVPFEYAAMATPGTPCNILLPDNTSHPATFTKSLSAMNAASQTQGILAKTNEDLLLPENMIVKVAVAKGGGTKKQLVLKTCVLSDEMMKEFWIMKLTNDSTAIKVPVKIGNQDQQNIEILSPVLTSKDRIISSGNYGLPDTAFVKIIRH